MSQSSQSLPLAPRLPAGFQSVPAHGGASSASLFEQEKPQLLLVVGAATYCCPSNCCTLADVHTWLCHTQLHETQLTRAGASEEMYTFTLQNTLLADVLLPLSTRLDALHSMMQFSSEEIILHARANESAISLKENAVTADCGLRVCMLDGSVYFCEAPPSFTLYQLQDVLDKERGLHTTESTTAAPKRYAFTLPVISEELELPLSTQISHVLPLLELVMHLNAYAVDDTICRWSEEFEAQMRVCATPSQSTESIRYTCPSCGLCFASRRTVQPIAGLCRRCAEN